jgi:hypothetical protein
MRKFRFLFIAAVICWCFWQVTLPNPGMAGFTAQIPTGSIATVTSTVTGPVVSVRIDIDQPQINVRSGPGTNYEKVGVMLLGQKAVAKGRSPGGDWILIDYPGVTNGQAWVYAPLVNITPGELKIIELPPTPTPLVTVTIDPTMAAQFVITVAPSRLPTFTPAPQLAIPTYAVEGGVEDPTGIPMGIVILGLAAAGLFLGLFALAQGR